METQSINGQTKKIGHVVVRWYLTGNQTFYVEIKRDIGFNRSELKGWEFEQSPLSEAVSFYWFEYVVRSIEQQYVMGIRTIPEFLVNTSDSDALSLMNLVFNHL
jgi:hypothetical protein